MVSLQFLSIPNHQLLPFSYPIFSSNNAKLPKNGDYSRIFKILNSGHRSLGSLVVHAGEEEFEIDPDKAREALQQLDQQIQELSQKQVSVPKTKAVDVKITRDAEIVEEELKEVKGSTVALITAAFFLFTIFYNIFYITVIDKPR